MPIWQYEHRVSSMNGLIRTKKSQLKSWGTIRSYIGRRKRVCGRQPAEMLRMIENALFRCEQANQVIREHGGNPLSSDHGRHGRDRRYVRPGFAWRPSRWHW